MSNHWTLTFCFLKLKVVSRWKHDSLTACNQGVRYISFKLDKMNWLNKKRLRYSIRRRLFNCYISIKSELENYYLTLLLDHNSYFPIFYPSEFSNYAFLGQLTILEKKLVDISSQIDISSGDGNCYKNNLLN